MYEFQGHTGATILAVSISLSESSAYALLMNAVVIFISVFDGHIMVCILHTYKHVPNIYCSSFCIAIPHFYDGNCSVFMFKGADFIENWVIRYVGMWYVFCTKILLYLIGTYLHNNSHMNYFGVNFVCFVTH